MATAAGAILALAFPPLGWWPLAIAGPALWLLAIRRSGSFRIAAIGGAAFGAAFMVSLMWWLINLRLEALVALAASQVGFFVGFAMLVYSLRRTSGWQWVAVVTGGWAAMEFARARVPLGGLEWGGIGYPAGEWEVLRDGAAHIGATGWGVAFAAVAALAVSRAPRRRIVALTIVVGTVAVAIGLVGNDPSGSELRSPVDSR